LGDAEAGTTRVLPPGRWTPWPSLEPPSRAPWRSTSQHLLGDGGPHGGARHQHRHPRRHRRAARRLHGLGRYHRRRAEARVWPELEERLAAW